VVVDPGETCPDAVDVTYLGHANCCPTPEYHDACTYLHREYDKVWNYYGGFDDAAPGDPNAFDVCYYEGVFSPGSGSCCGRPLLCDGAPVVADPATRSDWADRPGAGDAMARDLRRQAGLYWLRSAQLEHASVASFARFALELLRFGAPPDLIDQAMQAGRDEVEHARLCYALASSLLGRSLGPDTMELTDAAQLAESKADFAEALLREGCIGETLAVLDAAARLAVASDPAVCAALQTILDDEARHAALAWQAMAWLLRTDDGTVRAHLETVLAEAQPTAEPGHHQAGLGLVTTDAQRDAFERGWRAVIEPMWHELAA